MENWNLTELQQDIWKQKYQYKEESFEEWLDRVSNKNERLKNLIRDKKFIFGGRILANRGLHKKGKKITYSNCYVVPAPEDSIEGIFDCAKQLARTFSYGGGVGIDISKLRPNGAIVNNAAKTTTGSVSFMELYSMVTDLIGQSGRRGALMISLNVNHPDIEDFINIKTDLTKVTKANISVMITDDFMKSVKNNEMYDCKFFVKDNPQQIIKKINARELFLKLCYNNWNFAEPGILYKDRIDNYNLLQYDEDFEYAGVNPCAEEPLPAGGSCLLGSFNLAAYVNSGIFEIDEFKKDIFVVVEAMNEVLDEGLPLHPLKIQRETVKNYRQIGIGVMGIADMLINMGIKYGSKESLDICDKIGETLANNALRCSALLARDYGPYPKYKDCILKSDFLKENADKKTINLIEKYGLRNSQILTIAPTGSISTMLGISGGIEPIFAFSYTRKTESLYDKDKYYKVYTPIVQKFLDENNVKEEELPDYFISSAEINPIDRVKMQGVWQKHIDASISSTVNLPNSATIDDVYNIYTQAWEQGLKGITIYRSGCAREGILTTNDKNKENELVRGEWSPIPQDTIYVKRKIYTGCGKLVLFVGYSKSENKITDFYIKRSASGGCVHNIDAVVISMSGMLRLGGNLDNIEKAYRGCGTCPSFTSARVKGEKLSKGKSCPTAILNAIKEVEKELIEIENVSENIKVSLQNSKQLFSDNEKTFIEKNGDRAYAQATNKCPICNNELENSGGCQVCPSCGWSKCM